MRQGKTGNGKRLGYGCLVFSVLILLCSYQEYQYYLQQDVQNMFFYGILIILSVVMLVRAVVMWGHGTEQETKMNGKERRKRV